MPASFLSSFPHLLNGLETLKYTLQVNSSLAAIGQKSFNLGLDLARSGHATGWQVAENFFPSIGRYADRTCRPLCKAGREGGDRLLNWLDETFTGHLDRFQRERNAEIAVLKLFTDKPVEQKWSVAYDQSRILLDLPGLKLIDISLDTNHCIQNYGVVFAPRAGHHSNIAERVALFMREQGLTRMALVEQKCADDIPLQINGRRHYEGFESQVEQYRQVLLHLKGLTGYAPHLIAVCQPGPLLMSTLILNPELGKTFGSAGSPMHTEAERGFLTDFARMMGTAYIDLLMCIGGRRIEGNRPGVGREAYDGSYQVLGFYLLGIKQHYRNLKRLLIDLKQGNHEAAERQASFYRWYNYVHHFPAGFIRDTFKKIFVKNELIRGTLTINGKRVAVRDYPQSVPIWALGGAKDDIAPPRQATGHMDLVPVPSNQKLSLTCEGGHMGIFRSQRILAEYYARITQFILAHSD
jgi:polyhydroxyalkanoate depolymerase